MITDVNVLLKYQQIKSELKRPLLLYDMGFEPIDDDGCGRPLIQFGRKKTAVQSDKIIVKTIAVVVTKRDDKNYEWKDFKVEVRDDSNNSMCPLYRDYNPENFLVVHFSPSAPFDAVMKFLKNGVTLRYKNSAQDYFVFFGHSASQLRERTCVLYNETQGSVEDILTHFGEFGRIQDVAKRAARVGLLFSTAKAVCDIPEEQITVVDDVERDKFNFTDGCGFISTQCAQQVTNNLNIETVYESIKSPEIPSVFQIRLKGCKGVLCHNPNLEKGLQIRPSMEKFTWSRVGPHPLGIVDKGFSRPNEFGSLNKQYIMLLSALGIPDKVFLQKQEQYFKELQEITTSPEVALKYLCVSGEFELAEQLLKTRQVDQKIKRSLERFRNRVREPQQSKANPLQKTAKSAALKLKIPVEKSRNVYGVCDPSGNLKPKTVFFQPTIRGQPKVLSDMHVVVAKNPCYHPGDIRILQCTDVPECRHLVDCIVFPTEGNRPHPDEIAGSDLDGDKYFVCWDKDLVPEKEKQPCLYPAARPNKRSSPTREDFLKHFARYSNATVGKLDSLFDRWADSEGINSTECKMVAACFSRAIDAAKTGERVRIPPNILNAPVKDDSSDKFIWQKLYQRAKIFESDQIMENAVRGNVNDFEEEDMLAVIRNQESRLSEYRLFRFLYKWCHQPDNERDILHYISEIDFTKFSEQQRRLLPADIPYADMESLLQPLHQSRILLRDDIEAFKLKRGHERRWRLVYKTDGEEMSWSVLNNVLNSPLEKLLVFNFFLGGIQWVISLTLSVPLNSCEVMTLSNEDRTAQAFVSVHVHSGERHVLELKEGYSFALEGRRLDIYTGKKQNTFICLREDENDRVPIMSVALDRFRSSLPRDYQTRLRREKFLQMEVFCAYNHSDPGQKIQKLSSQHSVWDSDSDTNDPSQKGTARDSGEHHEFVARKGDFPSIHCDPEELISDLDKVFLNVHEQLEKGWLQSSDLDEIHDRMTSLSDEKEKHQIACHLESVLWRTCSNVSLKTNDHYKNVLICLLSGLQEFHVDVVLGETVLITLVARVKRYMESLWKRDVGFTVEQMYGIIDAMLLGNDYKTGCRIVQVIRQGDFPLEGLTAHPNTLPYFLHWFSLTTLESLAEIKQAVLTSHTTHPRDCVKAEAKSCSDQELSFTMVITAGSHAFRPADGVALSRSDISKRQYVGEVTAVDGIILGVSIVWPTSADDSSKKNIVKGTWCLYKFPSLVGYRRITAALKAFVDMTACGKALFEGIVGSFSISYPDSLETHEERDKVSATVQGGAIVSLTKDEENVSVLAGAFERWDSGNESQNAAVQDATCRASAITLIQGPPGSGKTVTCAEIVRRWLQSSEDPVLLVAETNEGVDNLLKKLLEHGIQKEKIVRFGSSGWKVAKELEELTFESRYREQVSDKKDRNRIDKKTAKNILESSKVLCTTCISAGSALLDGIVYQRVLIDEASQATEPAILVPLSHGCQKLVLVGDDQQLPPMVLCELVKGPDLLSVPMFSRLRQVGLPVRMLDIQYRMHPFIASFPSNQFYDGRLQSGVSEEERSAPAGFLWPNKHIPVAFLTTPNMALESSKVSSKSNDFEARQVCEVVRDLLKAEDVTNKTIGVITPYKAQLKLITDKIKGFENVSVRTVDGFQGQERDVIVFSAVRCNEHGYVGFLDDSKRMNVLLTRARRGMIVIGNKQTLQACDLWRKWIEWVEENKLTRDCAPDVVSETQSQAGNSAGRRGRDRGSSQRGLGRGRRRGNWGAARNSSRT